MLMTKEQSDFYLKRMSLFMTTAQIASATECSWASVDNWQNHKGLPRLSMLPKFEDAFCAMLDRLERDGWDWIAEGLDEPRPTGSAKAKYSPDACKAFLAGLLEDGPKRYDWIMTRAKERIFSRSQISYAARQLGVKREVTRGKREAVTVKHVGEGKERKKIEKVLPVVRGTSIWSLNDANG